MSYVGDGSYFQIDNVWTIYAKPVVDLSKKEFTFLTKIGLRKRWPKQVVLIFYLDSLP